MFPGTAPPPRAHAVVSRAALAGLAGLLWACAADAPVAEPTPDPATWMATPVRCLVTRGGASCSASDPVIGASAREAAALATTVRATDAAAAPSDAMDARFGGSDVFVRIVTSAAAYDAALEVLSLDLRVQNLLNQAIGTSDGQTAAADGVRVGLVNNPPVATQGTGTITLTNADGTAAIAGPADPFLTYPGPVPSAATSGPRTWRFAMPSTVQAFEVRLLVLAPVPDESPTAFESPPSTSWTDVSAGFNGTCGIRGGQLYCWGTRSSVPPGDGSASFLSVPRVIGGLPPNVSEVAVGGAHACAVTTTGEIWCWGNNTIGQGGAGSARSVLQPTRVLAPAGVVFTRVSATAGGSCALDSTGQLWCWGANTAYRVGDSTLVQRSAATRVRPGAAVTFESIATARTLGGLTPPVNQGACAVTTDQRVFCWGLNVNGRFGVGTGIDTLRAPAPTATSGGAIWAQAAVGHDHACFRATTGLVSCAGGIGPELGDGVGEVPRPTPTAVAGGRQFLTVSAGRDFTCAVEQGTLDAYCWGIGTQGALGTGAATGSPLPVLVGGGLDWADVVAGGGATACGRTSTGQVYCWGANQAAEAGRGTDAPVRRQVLAPLLVTGLPTPVTHIDVGFDAACAVSAGTVYCWGDQLDAIATAGVPYTPASRPAGVLQGSGLAAAALVPETSAGTFRCFTLAASGMRCWGQATNGVLGDGLASAPASGGLRDVLLPSPVAATLNALQLTQPVGGPQHACAREVPVPNRVFCWGRGLIGNGNTVTTAEFTTPQQAGTGGYLRVAISNFTTCAITTSLTLECWGPGSDGRLGRSPASDAPSPTAISTPGLTWEELDGGPDGFCAIENTNRAVYCWGNNANGAMGQPLATPSLSVPTLVSGSATGLTGPAGLISVGSGLACATQATSVSCWGTQIPDRDDVTTNVGLGPVTFTGFSSVTRLSAGVGHVCVIRAGELWCAGRNGSRQLGIGSTATALRALQRVLPP